MGPIARDLGTVLYRRRINGTRILGLRPIGFLAVFNDADRLIAFRRRKSYYDHWSWDPKGDPFPGPAPESVCLWGGKWAASDDRGQTMSPFRSTPKRAIARWRAEQAVEETAQPDIFRQSMLERYGWTYDATPRGAAM